MLSVMPKSTGDTLAHREKVVPYQKTSQTFPKARSVAQHDALLPSIAQAPEKPRDNSFDVELALSRLSSEEKISLLSGADMWHTVAIPRLNIPQVRCSDGPNGVRGTAWLAGAPASCFPCSSGLGASFDRSLVYQIGETLGEECRARGVHCLLGPTTNIQRHPCYGRGFESFSEDPLLSGQLAKSWIDGVQSKRVMVTPKHFVANEQEHLRRSNDSIIDERTLHEIYLEPFRWQCKSKPKAFMTSYNRVNGTHVAEHSHLLDNVLRKTFEFDGLLMSDWSGTYSSSEAIKAGLDLEMPGPSMMRGAAVERDIISGKLLAEDVDKCARRVLHFVKAAIESKIPFDAEERSIDNDHVRGVLRKAARSSVVLLKNSDQLLPIRNVTNGVKVAVIGPNANQACISGGGSASLTPTYTVTPLKAIERAVKARGGSVAYEPGCDTYRWTPLVTPYIHVLDANGDALPSTVKCDFYDRDPWQKQAREVVEPIFTKLHSSSFAYFIDGIPEYVPVRGYVSMQTIFVPPSSGVWTFGLGVAGQADLYVNDKKVVDNSTNQEPDLLFFSTGAKERTAEIELVAGMSYQLEVRFSNFKQISAHSPYSGRRGGIRIGGRPNVPANEAITAAVSLCKRSALTVLVIGTTAEWESEGYDRDTSKLPGRTNELVEAVLATGQPTIIVNQSGMPVEMPWIDQASTLVQAFFGGNECGNAIADVLFGVDNPSGKLPMTWPMKAEDYPSHSTFGADRNTVYTEGIRVGYRYFDQATNPRSAFPFGYGLSYTTFDFESAKVELSQDFGLIVSFTVQNTGHVKGKVVPQIYIHQANAKVEKPEHELKGFTKIELSPGEAKSILLHLDVSRLQIARRSS